jgi:hypothetical protein
MSSLDLSKLSLGSGLPSIGKSSVKNQPSIPETHDIPSTITNLLRGQVSNVEAHLELLTTYTFDNADIPITGIEEDDIRESMDDDNFDTENSQKNLQAVTRSIINFLKDSTNKPLDMPSDRINEWFNMTTLNWDNVKNKWKSAEGIVSKVNLKNPARGWTVNDFAIMKMQQPNAFKDENLLHEILVGLILNNMREYLPCFMYTYGGIFCGYPTEDKLKLDDYDGLCGPGESHSILITENIPGNLTLENFIKDKSITEEEKDKVLLMLAFALNEANRKYKFNHGDLHSKNVMVRTLNKVRDFSFVYVDNSSDLYNITIKTKYVPMIIDYGRSNIKFEGYNLRPIEASANNPELSKVVGFFELWCSGGKRDEKGENCLPENLVFRGADIPGYDVIRLIITLDTSFISDDFMDAINYCFYDTNYDTFSSGSWKSHLKGNLKNYARFVHQTLSQSKDMVNNPMCSPGGFLGYIISNPNFVGSTLEVVPI